MIFQLLGVVTIFYCLMAIILSCSCGPDWKWPYTCYRILVLKDDDYHP